MAEQLENQVSLNWTMLDGYGGNVQVTMRATSLENWAEVLKARKAFLENAQLNGWTFPGAVKAAVSAPSAAVAQPKPANGKPAQAQPTAQPAAQPANGGGGQFAATELVSNMNEGKWYWKIKGGQWTKFGVTIWPEALDAAGLEHENGQAYNLAGWTAHYVSKPDGQPQKVTQLTPPIGPTDPF